MRIIILFLCLTQAALAADCAIRVEAITRDGRQRVKTFVHENISESECVRRADEHKPILQRRFIKSKKVSYEMRVK